MLTNLSVTDFQSVRNVSLDLGKYTVLVGKSNSGKSAILRALHTLIRNNFIPAYVRSGATNATVTATFDDGVVRTIRGKESTYVLNDERYTKCGREVPTEVATFIGMPLIAKEDIYFTNQFETPFLVSGKSTTASSVVGTITNVVTVQTLAQETNRKRLQSSQLLSTREGDLEALEADLSAYADLPDLEDALSRMRLLESNLEALERDVTALVAQVGAYTQVQSQIKPLPDLPNLNPACFITLDQLHQDVDALTSLLQQADKVPTLDVPTRLNITEGQLNTLRTLEDNVDELEGLITQIQEAKVVCRYTITQFDSAESRVSELQHEIDKLPVCETCGQPLDQE